MKPVIVSHQAKTAIATVLTTAAKEQQISTYNIQQELGMHENGEAVAILFTKWHHKVHVELLKRVASVLNVGTLISKILHSYGVQHCNLNECELVFYNGSTEHYKLLNKFKQQLLLRQQYVNPNYKLNFNLESEADPDDNENVIFLKHKNIIVGYAVIVCSSDMKNAVCIQDFCIDSKYRHIGYGSKFMDMLFQYIKEWYPSDILTVYMTAIRNDDIVNEFCQVNKFKEASITYSRNIVRDTKENTFTFSE